MSPCKRDQVSTIRHRVGSHLMRWGLMAALAAVPAGLGVGCEGVDLSDVNTKLDVREEVERILSALFPDLTEAEIGELASDFSLEAVLSLKGEIEKIRDVAKKLSRALFVTAEERVEQRTKDLEPLNGGFPSTLTPVGLAAFYDEQKKEARVELSGVFSGESRIELAPADVSIVIEGAVQQHTLECLRAGTSVDIVFLVDITGSMSPVIGAVRRSLQSFVSAIVESHIQGTIGVVTFQDSVGVNVSFQELAPNGLERSPFFAPVAISDEEGVYELQRFITRLEANSGRDIPENLAGAVDFARNNVVGLTRSGAPNVVSDGKEDVPGVSAWPALNSQRQIFVAFTDAPFHSDSRTEANSSLVLGFKPRPVADIVRSLHKTGTTVHVSDPSWIDSSTSPDTANEELDSDFFALQTGGLGVDRVAGYSLVDLELVVVAKETGLLDIVLDGIVASTCTARLPLPSLSADARIELQLAHGTEQYTQSLEPIRF
jgi:hypothetical protein